MKYMLDTNICIYLRKHSPENIIKKFKTMSAEDIVISSIVLTELAFGVYNSAHPEKNLDTLKKLVSPLSVLAYDESAAYCCGEIRAHLKKNGTPIGPMDILIAAHALSVNAILITNNTKEFSRIKNLRLENWT